MVPMDLNIGLQGLALIQGQIYNPEESVSKLTHHLFVEILPKQAHSARIWWKASQAAICQADGTVILWVVSVKDLILEPAKWCWHAKSALKQRGPIYVLFGRALKFLDPVYFLCSFVEPLELKKPHIPQDNADGVGGSYSCQTYAMSSVMGKDGKVRWSSYTVFATGI